MQCTSVFLNTTEVADFRGKNADVSRTHRLHIDLYVFWIFFRQGTTMISFFIVGYVWQIRITDRYLLHLFREQPRKGPSWIGLRFKLLKYFLFVLGNRLIQKFLYFLYLPQFVLDLVSLNLFLCQDLVTIASLRDLVMNGLWLKWKFFFLIGAELSNISQKKLGL